MDKGFYYIENSVDEYHSKPSAYFETLEEAKEAMKHFGDWFCGKGTGIIFFQPFGYKIEESHPYKGYTHGLGRKFICRAKGLNKKGEVIWSKKQF